MQFILATMCASTLASEAVIARSLPPPPRVALLRDGEPGRTLPRATLPPLTLSPLPGLSFLPKWGPLLLLPGVCESGLLTWQRQLTRASVHRLGVREVYARLATLPRLDRVGRFAHIDFPVLGLSAGAELLRLSPAPPREYYPRAQQLTPGWSIWYKPSGDHWAMGLATGTRFLMAEQSSTVVDPITSEARWAFFLP